MGMLMRTRRVLMVGLALLVLASSFPPAPAVEGPAMARVQDNDNDLANATACTSGQSYAGNVSMTDDPVDLYAVSATASGQVFNVSLYVPSYPSCKFLLAAFDLNLVPLDESYIDSRWQSLSVQAVKSNTKYYFSVSVVSGTGDYTLYYTLETPAVIAPGNSLVDRELARASDNPCDWFVFAMAGATNSGLNNDVAEFTIEKSPGLTLDVTLYALWTELSQYSLNISLDHQSGGKITAAATYSANYYLRLNARSGTGTYNVSMGVLQSSLNDGDNDGSVATKLNNTPVSSWVDQAYDHYDWYKVYLLEGETIDINMTLNQHTDGKYALWLYHIYGGLYTPVANATNFVPGVGWTDKVRLTKTVPVNNRYYVIPMAECGLDANGTPSSTPANASYTLLLGAPADINHAPILAVPPGYPSLQENAAAVIFNLNIVFEDPDGDQMFFNVTGSGNLTVKIMSDGGVQVTPAKDWSGTETIQIAATDSFGSKTVVAVHVTVWNVNQAPRINKQIANFTLQEDRVAELDISQAFWDPDTPYLDVLSYTWKGNVSIPISLDNATLMMSFGPVHGFLGTREIQLFARDLAKATTYMRFTVSINHTNHPPVLKGSTRIDLRTPEDTLNSSFLARDFFYDEDTTYAKDVLSFVGVRSAHVNCTIGADSRILVMPDADWSGQESVFVLAVDTGGLNVSLEVNVVVTPVNDPPHLISFWPEADEYPINETENLTLSVVAADIDSPAGLLTYQWYVDGIKKNSTSSSFTFVTDQNTSRQLPYKISVEVSDGEFPFTRTWNVPVFNVRQPPVVTITSPKDGAVVSDQNFTGLRADVYDPEHGNLAYSWKDGGATLGNLRTMTSKFSPGWHNVSIHVDYGSGTVVANVTIFSNSQPAINIIEPPAQSTRKTTDKVRFSAQVSDADGDPVTFEWREGSKVLSREANFTLKLSKGLHYIKISASDGRGSVESDELVIKVEEPAKAGFVPGVETVMVVSAVAVAAVLAVWRRRG